MRIVKVPGVIGRNASPGVSAAVWLILFIALCALSAAHESALPARFLLDAAGILQMMKSGASFEAFGDSFANLAWVFNFFGLRDFTISLLGFLAASFSMFFAIWRSGVTALKPAEFCLVAFWLVNQTVYIGLPSKEIVISILVLLLLFYSSSRAILPIFVVLAGLIAVYFRSYWGIVLSATVCLYLAPTGFRRPISLLLFSLFVFVVVAVGFQAALGEPLGFARQSVNEWRDVNDTASIIMPFIAGNGIVVGVANAAITLVTFIVPLRLIASGNAMQMLGGVGLCLTFGMLSFRYRAVATSYAARRGFERLCLCLLVSFVVTQAIFEPDYGSFLRHLSPISPLIVFFVLRLGLEPQRRVAAAPRALAHRRR
ncbi:hypothetical protein CI15_26935 [Paraburkholderia monticola]|uniref:Uncharacterized protein n=1 Tax=Paraburkholderia monticola TaxID=1399968 RepID=A0A149PGF0_9BURK|nr:hypothetical protein [Paraburkholderia monticola]KXU84133.1 hypothetical protein CI15_26935 [Paraburkholderia monticola]